MYPPRDVIRIGGEGQNVCSHNCVLVFKGINMPARTTVILSMAKRGDGSSMNLLETSNLLQMAGRAGRRGMDTDGTCVIVATPFENHDDASKILTDPIKPITSQFSPSYSLAVNLVARGEGKLDVARQLVSKSFAMWEKQRLADNIANAVETYGDGVSEVIQATAQESFMNELVNAIQIQIDQRRAKFDTAKLKSLLDILADRELLKKASKLFIGAEKMLELEEITLRYLKKEYETLKAISSEEDKEFLGDMLTENEDDLVNQIALQSKRAVKTQKEVDKHPFTAIAAVVNEILSESTPLASVLSSTLRSARQGAATSDQMPLTPLELSDFSKSAIVVRRKARKLAKTSPGLETQNLLEQADKAETTGDDSWDDMLSITKTLVAYGCLSLPAGTAFDDNLVLENEKFTLTEAGLNIGMISFQNSLWCLVAVGGTWDVVGASSKLDQFRSAMDSFDDDGSETSDDGLKGVSSSRQEANDLVNLLRSLTAEELAGYVSSLISENSRGGGSVVDLFQRLSPLQQRVIQKSLQVMERLVEVQKQYSVDESTRNCAL
jgi:hypothetical protein